MNKSQLRIITGWMLIATPVLMMTAFTLLQMNFEYPDILRQPTEDVLRKFTAGGNGLIVTWYVFAISAAMFAPVAVLMGKMFNEEQTPYMGLAVIMGVLAGLVQVLGLIRWVFVVPYLAEAYFAPGATAATQETVAVVFQAFHRYAGVAVGEHLGYLFTSIWTILVGVAMTRSPMFKAWFGWAGVVLGIGVLLGNLEPAGIEWAGMVSAISYTLWSVWLVVAGVFVLRGGKVAERVTVGASVTA